MVTNMNIDELDKLSIEDVYAGIKDGSISLSDFIDWHEADLIAVYDEGYSDADQYSISIPDKDVEDE
jgi:hypothetical protein